MKADPRSDRLRVVDFVVCCWVFVWFGCFLLVFFCIFPIVSLKGFFEHTH